VLDKRVMGEDMLRLKSVLNGVSGGIAGIAALVLATAAFAQVPEVPPGSCQGALDCVIITDTGKDAEGLIGVNTAAGDLNQQVNSAVIATGELAVLTNTVTQVLESNAVCDPSEGTCSARPQSANISDVFNNAHGAIAVNVAAGSENQQANLIAIGIGKGTVASLEILGQARASGNPVVGQDESSVASAVIGDTAFAGAIGIVQTNSTAGEGNSSANIFALVITGGANE
jgi:hypothetical protein